MAHNISWVATYSLYSLLILWEEYTKLLAERFGEVCDDPMTELMRLRQKKFVFEYHEEFDSIVNTLNLSEEYMLSSFWGLKEGNPNV